MNIDKLLRESRDSDEIWVNEFDGESALSFRDAVMNASKEGPDRPIVIYIDSYGGSVDALSAMLQTMDEVPNPFITVAVGKAISCGAILLSHGDIRFCGAHARVMVHEVSGASSGDVHDMTVDVQETKRINEYFMGLLALNCSIKGGYDALRSIIKGQDGRDKYLTAQQAVEFGIADLVGMPRITKHVTYSIEVAQPKVRLRLDKPKKAKTKKAPKAKNPDPKKSRK